MNLKKTVSILGIILTNILIIFFLSHKIFSIPPLGKFLSPYTGYLNLLKANELPEKNLSFDALEDTVTVIWDELRIPHIFAKNNNDLYFSQGYVMARDRLWQMEFQTLAAAGRLSEILGKDFLDIDMFFRRIGIKYGAENSLETIKRDTSIYNMLISFSDGINSHINELNNKIKPIEYQILDYFPEQWTPYKTILILKYMAWTLSGKSEDLANSKLLMEYEKFYLDELFPISPYNIVPIIPDDEIKKNFKQHSQLELNKDVKQIKYQLNIPEPPKNIYKANPYQSYPIYKSEGGFSNNWVVSPKISRSKKSLLATDPHLGLPLPSKWYSMHLNSPFQNTMGVSIPGAPGIIIGFNEHIAWAETNGYDDVMDWYDIYFKDEKMNEYLFDNEWRKTTKIIEKYIVRNSEEVLDTIIYTHHGPVVWDYNYQTKAIGSQTLKGKRTRQTSTGRALRWLAHDGSNDIRTFYELNRAKNYTDFKNALKWFSCPGQNFAYIDKYNISMWHAGNPPIKWEGQGRFIGDGSDPYYDWHGFIPHNHLPHSFNPKNNFLFSANQHPTSNLYPYYLSETFWSSFRAKRINDVLSKNKQITIQEMKNLQNDNTNMLAKTILPHMISSIDELNLDKKIYVQIFDTLKNWNYENINTAISPTIFDIWYKYIENETWIDNFGIKDEYTMWPPIDKLCELIEKNQSSEWFDNANTKTVETFNDISSKGFKYSIDLLIQNFDKLNKNWEWGNYQGTNINHLAKIPGLGNLNLYTSGGMWTVNATTKQTGPSWRSIIEIGDTIKALGIYPGGQSGFPGSKYYDNMIENWINGNLFELQFSNDIKNIAGHKTLFTKGKNE